MEAKAATVLSTEMHALESTDVKTKETTSASEIDSTAGSQANLEKVGVNVNIADDAEYVAPGTSGFQIPMKPKRGNKSKSQSEHLPRENASAGSCGRNAANKEPKNKVDRVEVPKKVANGEPRTCVKSSLDEMVKVGVYDKSSFQSAEDFLVGRLVAVLNSSKKGSKAI